MAALGHEQPIWRCRHGASFALYVVGVCLNRIGMVRSFEFDQGLLFFLDSEGKQVLRLSRKS